MGQLQLLCLSIAFLQTVKCFFIKKICTPIIIPILIEIHLMILCGTRLTEITFKHDNF